MKNFSRFMVGALVIIVALVAVKECGYRQGRAEAEMESRDDSLDAVIRAGRQRLTADSLRFVRARDSTVRVIASLRSRVRVVRDTVVDSVYFREPVDSLIAAYEAGRQSDSIQLLFWQGVVSQRDSLIVALQTARNQWRAQKQSRFACVGGPAIAVGLNGQSAIGFGASCGWRF